jgi:hypothetical protein
MRIHQILLPCLFALALTPTAVFAENGKSKAELSKIVKGYKYSEMIHKLAVNKPSPGMLNSFSFNFDTELVKAMADTHVQRFFNATGQNLQSTLWLDKRYWEQSQFYDQYAAVVSEENAFKRKRAEKELGEALASAPDSTGSIIGKKFILTALVDGKTEFDFDTMSKGFTGSLSNRLNAYEPVNEWCLPGIKTTNFSDYNMPGNDLLVGSKKGRGPGLRPTVVFQTPLAGSFTDLTQSVPGEPCAMRAAFSDLDKAERFEEIMTGPAVLYYTGEITMYADPSVLMAKLEKVELYTFDTATGEIEETQFSWDVTKSLAPAKTLATYAQANKASYYEFLPEEAFSDIVDSEAVHGPTGNYSGPTYVQFKEGGDKLFIGSEQNGVLMYERKDLDGQAVYRMTKASGRIDQNVPLTYYVPENDYLVKGAKKVFLNFSQLSRDVMYRRMSLKVGQKYEGDLESQLQ